MQENKSRTRPRLILLVENTSPLTQNLCEILELVGYQTITAYSGHEGLRILADAEIRPDLILSEMIMPEMDGCEFLRAVRTDKRYDTIPFVLFSTPREVNFICPNLELHIDAYLPKPFSIDDLVMVIERVLSSYV
jgi:CheY-like chemotaxis protein